MSRTTHGGKRCGAGRPKTDDSLRKVPYNCRLPYWLVLWIRDRDESASELIEQALVNTFKAK